MLFGWLFLKLVPEPFDALEITVVSCVAYSAMLEWLFCRVPFGGLAVIQHFTLRFILYCSSHIPWSFVRFLDYAAERIFLRKVGGGYIFVHRLLQDYFASLYQDQ
jgi:hypothetical protein